MRPLEAGASVIICFLRKRYIIEETGKRVWCGGFVVEYGVARTGLVPSRAARTSSLRPVVRVAFSRLAADEAEGLFAHEALNMVAVDG